MTNIEPIRNPADIALPYAKSMMMDGSLDSAQPGESERNTLAELELQATAARMLNRQYYVKSGRSFITPFAHENKAEDVSVEHFDNGLDFTGTLFTYSSVRMDCAVGSRAIRALCLTFHEVLLLPWFDQMPEGYLLHTPAFAVNTIDQLS